MVLSILIFIGTLIIAFAVASLVTQPILMTLEKLADRLAHKPQSETNEGKYRIYIPYPIQNLRHLLNPHNYKSRIVNTKGIKSLYTSQQNPKPQNTTDTVGNPLPKLIVKPSEENPHEGKISHGATKCK